MNKALILVVEDDRPIRNLIVTTLKTHDYKYITAENGSSAILEASSHKPEIISYVILNVVCGKAKKITPLMYVLALLFILKYAVL